MAKTAGCVIVGQKSRGGSNYSLTDTAYIGYGNSTHYDYVLKFTTPSFVGTTESLVFGIKLYNSYVTETTPYRYALLSSDASATGSNTDTNYYYDKHTDVEDPNQITKGIVELSDIDKDTVKTFTIDAHSLEPNTDYFLVIWAYDTAGSLASVRSCASHSVSLSYNEGSYISYNDGGVAVSCEVYRNENGTAVRCTAYYNDNGTAVKL